MLKPTRLHSGCVMWKVYQCVDMLHSEWVIMFEYTRRVGSCTLIFSISLCRQMKRHWDFIFGTYRELSLTRSLHGHASALQYYYMGFYIHTCPKMRYKASYNPSFLLCPEVYTWHPVGECKARLDCSRYCRFNDDPPAKDKDGDVALNEVSIRKR